MTLGVSPARRVEIIDALGLGTVPARGLDVMAVELDRFTAAIDEELARVAAGAATFKAVRGEWGSGKTFAARWIPLNGPAGSVGDRPLDDPPVPWIAERLALKLKFADCVPDPIALDLAATRVSDRAGLERVMAEPIDQA